MHKLYKTLYFLIVNRFAMRVGAGKLFPLPLIPHPFPWRALYGHDGHSTVPFIPVVPPERELVAVAKKMFFRYMVERPVDAPFKYSKIRLGGVYVYFFRFSLFLALFKGSDSFMRALFISPNTVLMSSLTDSSLEASLCLPKKPPAKRLPYPFIKALSVLNI